MRTTTILFAIGMIISSWTFGQSAGSIKGRVLDAKTKEPIPGANVYVDMAGTKVGTTSDLDGRFTVKPLNAGNYQLTISYVSYNEKKVGVTVFSGEITFMKDVYLSDVIEIGGKEGIVVTADNKSARVIDPGQIGRIPVKAAELERMPNSGNVAMVLRNVTSEAQISDDGKDIVFRGSRNGSSAVYIDGVKQKDLATTVPGCSIGSIMVFTGGIPARYGDVTGGIVVIETKDYFSVRADYNIKEYNKKELQQTQE